MGNYLVVGGTRGIGRTIVDKLVGAGNQVVVLARNPPDDLTGAEFYPYNAVTDELPTFGFNHLDGMVYCPGSINLKPVNRLTRQELMDDLGVNYIGAFMTLQKTLPFLKRSGNASVVFFSTVAVGKGMPFHTSTAGAKGAVEGFSRSLAAELAPSIRVNCVAPSIVDTQLAGKILSSPERRSASEQRHPLKRVGLPDDIAAMVLFLLSDSSSWITGQVLHVDGGLSSL